MLTRHKLSASVAISIIAAVAVGALLYQGVQRVRSVATYSDLMFDLSKHLSQRRFSMVEYSAGGQDRSRLQWEADHRQVEQILAQLSPAGTDIELVEHLHRNHAAIRSIFDRLVAAVSDRNRARDAALDDLIQRLTAQLMARSQDMGSDALRLSHLRSLEEQAELRSLSLLVITITLLNVALVGANWLMVRKNLLQPMKHLEADAAAITAGDIGHRTGIATRDEIGALARNFDAMTAQLQESIGSLHKEIAQHKKTMEELKVSAAELARSNAELERFAYVASHDLQEPLRMVVSYVQLLEKRIADKLDADAREFMGFAIEGALRMQQLIQDILAYSRVNAHGQPSVRIDSAKALKQALALIAEPIAEAKATVEARALPVVLADETQLVQLFQNLVSNAVKFRHESAPVVRIEARRETQAGRAFWRFTVADNGIGVAPEYRDRIFVIFKRLHTRSKYPGTGMGLTICKRIVEHHGGEIGVEAAEGGGSVFWFTLPEENSA